MTSFSQELNFAITAAREASDIILAVYSQDFQVNHKARNEPVTEADRRVNAFLVHRFSSAYPKDGIIAEESVTPEVLKEQIGRERIWFIDPLDGTKEFIKRNGEFSVMIGMAVGGEPVLGVVAIPVTGTIVAGCKGQGTRLLSPDGSSMALQVSTQSSLEASTVIVSRSHMSEPLQRVIDAIGPAHRISCGSVGVKLARIAEKKADIYVNVHQPGGAKLWDGCAPQAILTAAGGKVTDLVGRPIDYARAELELTDGYVATNGVLHDAVIEAVSCC